MAKRFLCISVGILALAGAWHLGAHSARADWDPAGVGCIAGGDSDFWFSSSGEAYYLSAAGVWNREPAHDLPVPASSVRFFSNLGPGHVLVTDSDAVWTYGYPSPGWSLFASFPGCGGTATEKTSWGGVKRQFQK